MLAYLQDEFFGRLDACEAVVIGFREKLDSAGLGEAPEGLQNVRSPFAALIEERAGDGIRNGEIRMRLQEFQHESVCWEVALLGHFPEHRPVLLVVEIPRLAHADFRDP